MMPVFSPEPFAAPYAPPDEELASALLNDTPSAATRAEIQRLAGELVAAMRERRNTTADIEDFLHEFSLSSHEGLAVMALAESLLRVPDDATLDRLIADKLTAGEFARHEITSDRLAVQACAFALGLSANIVSAGETPHFVVARLARRLGVSTLRVAAKQAIRLMGTQFIFGETIDRALKRAAAERSYQERYSFDMLGEAARTAEDATRFWEAYAGAIEAIGSQTTSTELLDRPGISVKLSALQPRYEAISRERVLRELAPRVLELARLAKAHDLPFTIDAEEADRLELSLDVIAHVLADTSLAHWDGFGLAVQAYQKRAQAVITYVGDLCTSLNRTIMVRLVKGAYWDSEIKRAQERGLDDYPVFTRKAMTDLNYMACARKLFDAPRLFPQFATHNAATIAAIMKEAGARGDYEFQRLHGMGVALYHAHAERSPIACRVYAPVGPQRDLLAYLARRLIENGANSSFVARASDVRISMESLLADPYEAMAGVSNVRHQHVSLPREIYEPLRANSLGVEFGDRRALAALCEEIDQGTADITGVNRTFLADSSSQEVVSPIDASVIGYVREADIESVSGAVIAAKRRQRSWGNTPVAVRVSILERAADLIETRRGRFIALLQQEAGKTLDDALAEVREAADLCRYYAREARLLCELMPLPGPTGERNSLLRVGRGVFACISPWNFPLAIFLGQVVAALVTGNTVVAKPARQTPLVAGEAVALLFDAGLPAGVLYFLPGDANVGATLVAHPDISGVVFTGSMKVAQDINRVLADKMGAISVFVAETGGINAMIVDSTALLEQVSDDVLSSAFRSAGQRCSALRLLCLQEDIAERCLGIIVGAARELKIGDPREIGVHIGPVIDGVAQAKLAAYVAGHKRAGRVVYAGACPEGGLFFAPHIIRLKCVSDLHEEIFGPILHVVVWRNDEFDALVEEISNLGFGLTLGLHTRIESRMREIEAKAPAGNVYFNRNMIGAAVGGQPFGGFGLSGTGPKAGGPDYLRRFLRELTVTINTAALGGDAALMAENE